MSGSTGHKGKNIPDASSLQDTPKAAVTWDFLLIVHVQVQRNTSLQTLELN